ncbi:MAG: hypothetical protein GYA21_00855 [Myxococcales bacterium]|nr:hypothetical protein [Myxococcales bacterium]
MSRKLWLWGSIAALLWCGRSRAEDRLTLLDPVRVDRPTLIHLGVQLLIQGDDDHDATVSVRYRAVGQSAWRDGPPLFRVRPEDVAGLSVPEQFAGSLFYLRPGTEYEIELVVRDPDNGSELVRTLTARTRGVPGDPAQPDTVNVSDATGLRSALSAARAGTIIVLADGTYSGTFSINQSGTAENPIVIRGQHRDGAILDGGGSTGNVFEIYGSFVHLENLTLRNANRALRFQGAGTEGNVARRLRIRDVRLGIGSRENQKDFYICDNDLQGLLQWPTIYTDDGGTHANDDGINLAGDGHVVCHNRLQGFGDALKIEQDGSRAVDFYGNEVVSAYDNAIELDTLAGNGRAVFNRFTNAFMPASFQPVFGGPVYFLRNVVVNYTSEPLKFHNSTSGVLVLHNTFVSPGAPLVVWDDTTSSHFAIQNNIFLGPAALGGARTVDWSGTVRDGLFDYNAYRPDGGFRIRFESGAVSVSSFAALQGAGVESHGLLLAASPFESGLEPPTSYTETLSPPEAILSATTPALDRGLLLPGINDAFRGSGPDLGALERGCPSPIFGIRPEGVDERSEPFGCETGQPIEEDGGDGDAGSGDAGVDASDGSQQGDAGDASPGDPTADAGTDTGAADDGLPPADGGDGLAPGDGLGERMSGGCGCASAPAPAALGIAGLFFLRRRKTPEKDALIC